MSPQCGALQASVIASWGKCEGWSMGKSSSIAFAELEHFLKGLGYKLKRLPNACVFHHAKEGMLIFRLYREAEKVDMADLLSTRYFLDMWGLMESKDFDAFVQRVPTPA